MNLITLTTDFGQGPYVASMKGVILGINPIIPIVDISHTIPPQDLVDGAYVLLTTAVHFQDAVHVGVVDPEVGTARRGIAIECEGGCLVGPDNGLLVPAARRLGIKRVVHLTNEEFWLEDISPTFHGRDIFAPVAAHLTMGVPVSELGPEITDHVLLEPFNPKLEKDTISGSIVHEDRFGNLITDIPERMLLEMVQPGQSAVLVHKGGSAELPFHRTYGDADKDGPLLTISSSFLVELAVREGSAARTFDLGRGDNVTIQASGADD